MSYQITEEQKKILLQYSAQTLPDNPSRDGFSAETIRKRMYKPTEKLVDLINAVFDTVYTDVQSILSDIQNGDFFARSIASWSASYNYGANEITFYPSIGTYGAFVQSVVAGNTNNAPYINGAINSAFWKEVVNFNTIAEDYFQEVQAAVAQAESAASEAESSAQAAAGSATQSAGSAAEAAQSAEAAQTSAEAAQVWEERAANFSENAEISMNTASEYVSEAHNAADAAYTAMQSAQSSATEAQEYAEKSRIYSERALQYNYEYSSVAELPVPGSTRYIYMIPKTSPDADDYYDEYAWSEANNDYSLIGTSKTSVDLSNYYTKAEVNDKVSAETSAREQSDANLQQAVNAKYTKPSTGISESDLSAAVQTSLNKADTALQSIPIATQSAVGGVKPTTKTSEMTQEVGVDSNGALWTKEASEGTTVVANPTATGTQDLTSLQVGGTVYNIPQGGAVEYATDEEIDALFGSQDELIGTWVFNDTLQNVIGFTDELISFTSNSQQFESISYGSFGGFNVGMKYGETKVFDQNDASWINNNYKTIQITDVSSLTNREVFETWLKANATKQ